MSETQPPNLDLILNCNLCWRSFPPSMMPMRGRLNFCQTCASERSAECLERLNGAQSRPNWSYLALAILGFGLCAGAAWWKLSGHPSQRLTAEPVSVASEAAPLEDAAPAAPPAEPESTVAAIPVSALAPPLTALEKPLPPWAARLLPDPTRRSVEDVGHISLLFVTRPGTQGRMGMSSQLFITREAPNSTSAKLMTEVGSQMATSFNEGLRYVRKQPRDWERDFSVRLSFEDKFTSKDGGSAGTGFTIAMLSAIERIPLDPDVAVTGDLTVDGTVQPVGAVVEKLRGAIEGKCKVTLIPERNARDVTDFALLNGTTLLWETQVFSIATIDQALELARKDRPEKLQGAIARFNALRARLPATVTPNYLQSPVVQSELKEILRAAPNHVTAATLLQTTENQLPQELSLNRSVEEILAVSSLFVSEVLAAKSEASSKPTETGAGQPAPSRGITVFPEREFGECLKALQQLTPILDRRSLELKNSCVTYAGVLRALYTYQLPDRNAKRTKEQLAELIQREKGFIQQAKDDVEQARSRLLLSIRKLDVDGSMMAELRKK